MRISILAGTIGALLTGIGIGIQSTITSRVGSQIGDVRTGLLTNFLGGLIAGSLCLLLLLREGPDLWRIQGKIIGLVALAGLLGIAIITGISFSLQRAGIAAGLATVILGQLILSVIIDSFGIGGVEPIPFSFQRAFGLLLMGCGVYFLLPKS